MSEISIYNPSMLVWIDESGCNRRSSRRTHAYSVTGIPPCNHRILIRGIRYSAIGVMALEDVHICSARSSKW